MNAREVRERLDRAEEESASVVGEGELSLGTGALILLGVFWLATEYGSQELKKRGA